MVSVADSPAAGGHSTTRPAGSPLNYTRGSFEWLHIPIACAIFSQDEELLVHVCLGQAAERDGGGAVGIELGVGTPDI